MKWGKITLVIFSAVVITALGIDAADTVGGKEGTLLSQVIKSTGGACPPGMTEVTNIPTLTCADTYEVSPNKDCPNTSPEQVLDTQENLGEQKCAGEAKSGVTPWRFVTRDQAMQFCARSGKRLPTSGEWYQLTMGMANAESVCNVCVKADSVPEVTHTDRIFAAIDAEGDKEIYVEKDGELIPLTNNQYDDDAPYYDELSNTAVWHRLIDGRYQIISFDFDTEEEIQFTHDRYNNMEPHRFGSITVWQGWVGNDWEVFLLEDNELTMLTDNTTHDITPGVNGTHVVWQSFENSAWVMKVYDIRSKVTATIDDEGGGSIENPRFVLVYDSKQETGDIETRGYDLKSGEVIALGSAPVNLPDEIPDPDQTGEERALVTTITQLKPKTDDEGGDEPLPDAFGTSTPSSTEDVVIPGAETSSSTEDVVIDEIIPDESDVVVAPLDTATTTDTSHIEDVVITPYVEPITSTDSTH